MNKFKELPIKVLGLSTLMACNMFNCQINDDPHQILMS